MDLKQSNLGRSNHKYPPRSYILSTANFAFSKSGQLSKKNKKGKVFTHT